MQLIYHMLSVSELYVYPIKSLGGIAVTSAVVTSRGLQYDRRWMLVDKTGMFLTQRDLPQLALLQVQLEKNGLIVFHKQSIREQVFIPFSAPDPVELSVVVWNDSCLATTVSAGVDAWFSRMLQMECRLVYMPEHSIRLVDEKYAIENDVTSFSDAYPMLMIGQSSLDDLNARLTEPVPMNRFRPNIVFTGGTPYQEDEMEAFSINGIQLFGVKPCARCVVTTIDQDTGVRGKDPLRTLATYRSNGNKVLFGQNLLHKGEGRISRGDNIILHSRH